MWNKAHWHCPSAFLPGVVDFTWSFESATVFEVINLFFEFTWLILSPWGPECPVCSPDQPAIILAAWEKTCIAQEQRRESEINLIHSLQLWHLKRSNSCKGLHEHGALFSTSCPSSSRDWLAATKGKMGILPFGCCQYHIQILSYTTQLPPPHFYFSLFHHPLITEN